MTDTCLFYLYFFAFIAFCTAFLAVIWWQAILLFFGLLSFVAFILKGQQIFSDNKNTNTK